MSSSTERSPTLASQIAERIMLQIQRGELQQGGRLDSLRVCARITGCAVNTVVDAYEQLVAEGVVEPRRGSGYFITGTSPPPVSLEQWAPSVALALQGLGIESSVPGWIAGSPAEGLPPSEWLESCRLDRYVHKIGRAGLGSAFRTGDPRGYPPLRGHIARRLDSLGIKADPSQVILTQGANQAVDIIIRTFIRPGDPVLVDEPGYYPTFAKLKLHGARCVPVPRTPTGPDPQHLRMRAEQTGARFFFTQSLAHNPTGADISPPTGRELVELAQRMGLLIVDDDALSDFKPASSFRLPSLAGLDTTLYVGSFSKSIASLLRVGFIACDEPRAQRLTHTKTILSLNSSQLAERAVDAIITEARYNRHLFGLQERLRRSTDAATRVLHELGAEVFGSPHASLYLWARFPGVADSSAFARTLAARGVVLAPGAIFYSETSEPVPWMRFNAAFTLRPHVVEAIRVTLKSC